MQRLMDPIYFIICRNMGVAYHGQIMAWTQYHGISQRYYIVTDKSSDETLSPMYRYTGALTMMPPFGSIVLVDTGSSNDYGIGAKRNLCVKMAMGSYCVMIDDNMDLIDYRGQWNTTGSVTSMIGMDARTMKFPMTKDERQKYMDLGVHTKFGPLTMSIIRSNLWVEDENMVIAGVMRHDHMTSSTTRQRMAGEAWPSWKVYKYAVINTMRLGSINYDPNLTVLGEDVLLYTRLKSHGKTAYLFGTGVGVRINRPFKPPSGPSIHSATIDADYFVNTYMGQPSISPSKMSRILAGGQAMVKFDDAFIVRYNPGGRDLIHGTRLNPYITVMATTGVPVINHDRTVIVTGVDPNGIDPWSRFTMRRSLRRGMLRPMPQGKLVYSICPPSMVLEGGDKYDHIWRFLIMYGMAAISRDRGTMRSLFLYLYDRRLPISFDKDGYSRFIVDLEDGHDERVCPS